MCNDKPSKLKTLPGIIIFIPLSIYTGVHDGPDHDGPDQESCTGVNLINSGRFCTNFRILPSASPTGPTDSGVMNVWLVWARSRAVQGIVEYGLYGHLRLSRSWNFSKFLVGSKCIFAGQTFGCLACLSNLQELEIGHVLGVRYSKDNKPPAFSLDYQTIYQLQPLTRLTSLVRCWSVACPSPYTWCGKVCDFWQALICQHKAHESFKPHRLLGWRMNCSTLHTARTRVILRGCNLLLLKHYDILPWCSRYFICIR